MPLPEPQARTLRHSRRIQLDGYEREDGLWDIEARLVDTKGYDFDNQFRGTIPSGEPLHDIWMRITVDDTLTIREVAASIDSHPFPPCPGAATAFQQLVGMRIASGWTEQAKEQIGQVAGCTHLFELLRPLATTAIQTIAPIRRPVGSGDAPPKYIVDTCRGWAADSVTIRTLYPGWRRDTADDDA